MLGAGGGGYSGQPIHPVAVRTVFDVHAALPELPIIGVGGVVSGWDAVELILAGASAVQVGTASFVDPRASMRVLGEVEQWCADTGIGVGRRAGRRRSLNECARMIAWSGLGFCVMATPPQLTPEQRTAALAKAAEARAARAELKNQLKNGSVSIREALASTSVTVGKLKVVSLLESLPGVGKVKARKIMEDIGIADNRRVQGLGAVQKQSLLDQLGK